MRESRKQGPGGMIRKDDKGAGREGKTANSCGERDWECQMNKGLAVGMQALDDQQEPQTGATTC